MVDLPYSSFPTIVIFKCKLGRVVPQLHIFLCAAVFVMCGSTHSAICLTTLSFLTKNLSCSVEGHPGMGQKTLYLLAAFTFASVVSVGASPISSLPRSILNSSVMT